MAAVRVGLPAVPSLSLPLDDLLPAVEADQQAIAAELEVTVLTPALRIAAGGRGELAVRLANRAASPIRGEAQLISPFGSWAAVSSVDARFRRLTRKGDHSPLSCASTGYYPTWHAVVDNGQTDVFRSSSLHQRCSR